MTTIPIKQFIPYVAPEVLGCPGVMMRGKIIQAAIELCKISKIWMFEHPDINLTANTRDYPLAPPTGSLVADIISINIGSNSVLMPSNNNELSAIYDNWRTEFGNPVFYLRMTNTSLTIVPTPPTAGDSLYVFCSLKPTYDAVDLPDFIFNEYLETVSAGAKYMLMSIPDQKWTNTAMAAYYRGIFNHGIGRANANVAQGNVSTRIRVKPNI